MEIRIRCPYCNSKNTDTYWYPIPVKIYCNDCRKWS